MQTYSGDLSKEDMIQNLKSYIEDNLDVLCQIPTTTPVDFYNNITKQNLYNSVCKKALRKYKSNQEQFDSLIEKLTNSDLDTLICRLINVVHSFEFDLESDNKKKAILKLYKLHIVITLLIKTYSMEVENNHANSVQKNNS